METFSFENPLLRHYTVFDGLAGMHVEDIHQDRRGFLWIATADGGVSRFDGVHFDNFTENDGLPHPTVMGIAETEDGALWFATLGGGVARYYGREFTVVGEKDGLPSNDVLGVRTEADGSVWAMTENGVGRIGVDGHVDTFTHVGGEPLGFVYDAITDARGTVWLATMARGVVSLDGCTMGLASADPRTTWAWKLSEDTERNVWISTQYVGSEVILFKYDPRTRQVESIRSEATLETKVARSGVRHIRIDDRRQVWAVHRGVFVFDGVSWRRFGSSKQLRVHQTITDRFGGARSEGTVERQVIHLFPDEPLVYFQMRESPTRIERATYGLVHGEAV